MKINPNRISHMQNYQKWNQQQKNHIGKQGDKKDQLKISSEAKEMLETTKTGPGQATDPNRQERIDGLKEQISSGTYQIDYRKVAEKFLSFWK